jgi:hypothetical protein
MYLTAAAALLVSYKVMEPIPLVVSKPLSPSKRSVNVILPARPKSHSAFKVYLPIGESPLI